jgi:hypothetical protein
MAMMLSPPAWKKSVSAVTSELDSVSVKILMSAATAVVSSAGASWLVAPRGGAAD